MKPQIQITSRAADNDLEKVIALAAEPEVNFCWQKKGGGDGGVLDSSNEEGGQG
jgi:hypothetical protein